MVEEKKCPNCNLVKHNSLFYKNNRRSDGLRYYCKECELDKNSKNEFKYKLYRKKYRSDNKESLQKRKKIYYEENKESLSKKSHEYNQTLKGRYISYRNGSNLRKLEWNLTMDEFESLWNKNCHYCNDSIKTIGIDRINNSLGYFMENCIPCCTICNKMKMDSDKDVFILKIKKIYENLGLGEFINLEKSSN